MEQLEDNLGTLAVELTVGALSRIEEVTPPGLMVPPYYQPDVINTDFGLHTHRW